MDTEDCLEFKHPEPKPFFDEYQRHKLKLGKYTRWAENIDAESLYAVLWMVGEYACRSDKKWPRTAGPFMPWRKGLDYKGEYGEVINANPSIDRREAALQQLVTLYAGIQCDPWVIKDEMFPPLEKPKEDE